MITSLTQITQVRLIKLRWLSVFGMVAAALVSPKILGSGELMPRLLAFSTVVGSVNVCLLLAILLYRGSPDELPVFSPLVQLLFDLAAWGGYIFLSGGATNPLISVFLPLAAIGAIVLSPAQAWGLGLAAVLAYSFLWRFNQPLNIADAQLATHLHLLGMWLVFAVSAMVVIWFIGQMRKTVRERDAALALAREQAIRDDWLISMGSLAAGAAHELSTPLATLNVLVDELLLDAPVVAERHADLCLMLRQIEACKQALNQLTSRAGYPREASGVAGMPAATSLRTLLAAWLALHPAATVTMEFAGELEHLGYSPDIALDRAMTNLLDNASKAGATIISFCGGVEADWLVISIVDNGPGIAGTVLKSLAAGMPSVSESGMGIGLLLARAAIERQGGRLEICATPGLGTCARIFLPYHPIAEST